MANVFQISNAKRLLLPITVIRLGCKHTVVQSQTSGDIRAVILETHIRIEVEHRLSRFAQTKKRFRLEQVSLVNKNKVVCGPTGLLQYGAVVVVNPNAAKKPAQYLCCGSLP